MTRGPPSGSRRSPSVAVGTVSLSRTEHRSALVCMVVSRVRFVGSARAVVTPPARPAGPAAAGRQIGRPGCAVRSGCRPRLPGAPPREGVAAPPRPGSPRPPGPPTATPGCRRSFSRPRQQQRQPRSPWAGSWSVGYRGRLPVKLAAWVDVVAFAWVMARVVATSTS